MYKWEYLIKQVKTLSYTTNEINKLGQDGWELCAINYDENKREDIFLFKRQINDIELQLNKMLQNYLDDHGLDNYTAAVDTTGAGDTVKLNKSEGARCKLSFEGDIPPMCSYVEITSNKTVQIHRGDDFSNVVGFRVPALAGESIEDDEIFIQLMSYIDNRE